MPPPRSTPPPGPSASRFSSAPSWRVRSGRRPTRLHPNTVVVWDPARGRGAARQTDRSAFRRISAVAGFFKRLSSYADRAGFFVPGAGSGVVHAGRSHRRRDLLEVIFDRALRESVRNGAQVLAVPSNNATFDQNMSRAAARVRQGPGGRTRSIRGGRGNHRDQCRHRSRRTRTRPYRILHIGLSRRSGPIADVGDAGHPLGPLVQWALVGGAFAVIAAAVLHVMDGSCVRCAMRKRRTGDS